MLHISKCNISNLNFSNQYPLLPKFSNHIFLYTAAILDEKLYVNIQNQIDLGS